MTISINWPTGVIFIPQADLTFISGTLYELDVNEFRQALKDLEDSEDGAVWPSTHRHNTTVTLSGVTYARTVEIINGYTVEFEDGQYTVRCTQANHNIGDVKVANQVSIIIGNSAGLVEGDGGATAPSVDDIWANPVSGTPYTSEQILKLLLPLVTGTPYSKREIENMDIELTEVDSFELEPTELTFVRLGTPIISDLAFIDADDEITGVLDRQGGFHYKIQLAAATAPTKDDIITSVEVTTENEAGLLWSLVIDASGAAVGANTLYYYTIDLLGNNESAIAEFDFTKAS